MSGLSKDIKVLEDMKNSQNSSTVTSQVASVHHPLSFSARIERLKEKISLKKQPREPEPSIGYRGERFLVNDYSNRSMRSVKFNKKELIELAISATGAQECTEFRRLCDGEHNVVYYIILSPENHVIAKLPNSLAGYNGRTVASEAATMDLVGQHTLLRFFTHKYIG